MWYAVHILVSFESSVRDDEKGIIVEGSVVLMNASSPAEILSNQEGIKEMYCSSSSYLGKGPADAEFLGIRKIVLVSNDDGGNNAAPGHLSEITYEIYEFSSEEDLDQFVQGKAIIAKLDDSIPRS